jgi:hypothetical protein
MNKLVKVGEHYVMAHGRRILVHEMAVPGTPRAAPRLGIKFVKLPMLWIEKLHGGRSVRTFELAHLLLVLHFQHRGHSFKLSNEATRGLKLDRHTKSRILSRLEHLGLISVRREGKAAPLIKVKD